ncbi:MAG: DoxX family protein [Candidatus Omnitrophica bacterium]|nr:DoxX family protein [Candidatus Omnitrophota bacterium]MDD5488600.1 DoxX family protein [Candidatus Omnitrophota bacterium]
MDKWREWAALPIRLGLGVMFMAHGLQKVFGLFGGPGIENFAKFLGSLNIDPPVPMAYMAGYGELLGGLCLILGLFTRLSAGVLTVIMVVAAVSVHLKNGFFLKDGGIEYVFVIVAACVSLMVSGGGKLSITKKL